MLHTVCNIRIVPRQILKKYLSTFRKTVLLKSLGHPTKDTSLQLSYRTLSTK